MRFSGFLNRSDYRAAAGLFAGSVAGFAAAIAMTPQERAGNADLGLMGAFDAGAARGWKLHYDDINESVSASVAHTAGLLTLSANIADLLGHTCLIELHVAAGANAPVSLIVNGNVIASGTLGVGNSYLPAIANQMRVGDADGSTFAAVQLIHGAFYNTAPLDDNDALHIWRCFVESNELYGQLTFGTEPFVELSNAWGPQGVLRPGGGLTSADVWLPASGPFSLTQTATPVVRNLFSITPIFVGGASASGAGTGDVVGPAGATDDAVALFSGATGKLLKNSLVTIDGAGNITTPGTVDGRDIAVDGAKLDGIAAGATNTPLSAVAPVDVTKAAAAVGVAVTAARSDHKHDITTAVAVDVTDATNAEGVATTLARSDHTHAHGSRGGGALHALAIASGAAGFMSGADKAKLDALPVSGASSPVTWGANSVTATTTTRYLFPGYGDATGSTTPVQFQIPRSGTLQNMRVVQNGPAGNGEAIVYTLRVNNVATALAASLLSTDATGANLVDTVAVVAGDFLDVEVTKALAVGSSPSDIALSMEFV